MSQSVASLTADPGVASSLPSPYFQGLEIDHEIISIVTLLNFFYYLFQAQVISILQVIVSHK